MLIKISGKNGIGKTTFLKQIIKDYECSFKPQTMLWFDLIDKNKNVAFADEIDQELYDLLNIKEFINNEKLSYGETQRVAICRTFSKKTDIYVLDEPLNGLDKDNIEKIIDYIKNIAKDKTIVFVDHLNLLPSDIEYNLEFDDPNLYTLLGEKQNFKINREGLYTRKIFKEATVYFGVILGILIFYSLFAMLFLNSSLYTENINFKEQNFTVDVQFYNEESKNDFFAKYNYEHYSKQYNVIYNNSEVSYSISDKLSSNCIYAPQTLNPENKLELTINGEIIVFNVCGTTNDGTFILSSHTIPDDFHNLNYQINMTGADYIKADSELAASTTIFFNLSDELSKYYIAKGTLILFQVGFILIVLFIQFILYKFITNNSSLFLEYYTYELANGHFMNLKKYYYIIMMLPLVLTIFTPLLFLFSFVFGCFYVAELKKSLVNV